MSVRIKSERSEEDDDDFDGETSQKRRQSSPSSRRKRCKVQLKWDTDETVRLIDAVRKHSALWDSNHRNYKNRSARDEIWHEIGKELFADDYPDIGQLAVKWSNLRIQFKTYYLKTLTGAKKIHWRFYENMLFLTSPNSGTSMSAEKRLNLNIEKTSNCTDTESSNQDDDENLPIKPIKRKLPHVRRRSKDTINNATAAATTTTTIIGGENIKKPPSTRLIVDNMRATKISPSDRRSMTTTTTTLPDPLYNNIEENHLNATECIILPPVQQKRTNEMDSFEIFGNYIAEELRKISNVQIANKVQRKITRVLMDCLDEIEDA